jgi:cytochrome c oxidase subunit IV
MTETTHPAPDYKVYLKVWLTLLVITLVMVFVQNRAVLIGGMVIKASLIVLWFMHLLYERIDFILLMVVSIAFFSILLFGLIAPDGLVM